MALSEIKVTKSNNVIVKALINTTSKDIKRIVIVEVGKEMVVKPLNKQKLKHRDRRVIINKITEDGFKGTSATVKFLDNNRTGKVDITDLDDLI